MGGLYYLTPPAVIPHQIGFLLGAIEPVSHSREFRASLVNATLPRPHFELPRLTRYTRIHAWGAAKDLLPGNLRLSDECSRLRKGCGDAHLPRVPAGTDCRR